MPKREIEIGKIRWDATDLQARVRTDPATVASYAERMEDGESDAFPAIIVFHDGANYWPADGWHTGAAAEKAGFGTVPCDVRQGTREDAFDYALSANASHGLPRSAADKRKAVEMALACDRHSAKSDNAVAELCRVSHSFVAKVRSQVATNQPERRTGADGKSYPAKRTKADNPAAQNAAISGEVEANQTKAASRGDILRKTVPFKADSPKRPKPFVDRFDSLFGPLVRFLDEAAEHFGEKGGPGHKRMMDSLNDIAEAYGNLRAVA